MVHEMAPKIEKKVKDEKRVKKGMSEKKGTNANHEKKQDEHSRAKALGVGVCARCRWSSGCASCDLAKAERYMLRIESERRGLPMPPTHKYD